MTIPVPVPVSQFPNGTLPLNGTEVLPIVQNGITCKVPTSAIGALAGALQPEGTFVAAAGINVNVPAGSTRWIFVDTAAGDATIASFLGGVAGLILVVTNLGPNFLVLEGAGIYGPPGLTLISGASMLLYYSDTLDKWVLI